MNRKKERLFGWMVLHKNTATGSGGVVLRIDSMDKKNMTVGPSRSVVSGLMENVVIQAVGLIIVIFVSTGQR